MTLFSIARKNIWKNFTNYCLYIGSMIFSIVIYFTFVSLKYEQTIQETTDSSTKISSVFNGASVVLMIFVAVFIWYSNSFFTKKRKKEVGLYSLLGVRKKQIGRMLFYENFIMGIIALLIGIILGSILSKFFVTMLMKVMGYDAIGNFVISPQAIINTIIVFTLITAITSIHGYRLIYRFKLIELFKAEQEGEQEPKASVIVAIISVLLIGIGYWLALQNLLESDVWRKIGFTLTPLVILVTVILGTYLLFNTLTVYLLKLLRNNKRHFWNGINLISTSQLLYRIKGNARTLTIIAVLSATTLTAVGAVYSFYYNNRHNAEMANPNSMMYIAKDKKGSNQIYERISQDKDHEIIYHEAVPTMLLNVDITNLHSKNSADEVEYTIIDNKTYNQLAKWQKRDDSLSLKGNEAAALDTGYFEGLSPKYIGSTISLKVNDLSEDITFTKWKKFNVLNLRTAGITVVVSDELFSKLASETNLVNMEVYKLTNEEDTKILSKQIQSMLQEDAGFSSFYSDYSQGMESSGLLIFMGGFLGLVFLAATGSIIYFKQLTETSLDKERYVILHKIGVNKNEVKKSIAKQILFIFALPLLAGIAHSIVALTALSNLLQTNLVIPVFICIGVYACMYIAYYFLTVRTYYKIVMK
ncbi:ABC transporter permease [Schinkia azotoformans]|uniref:ABC transporter permease n=1 Tax=Schinkia azotoformans LMG 9581 TaxID=1131731 RepID=K6D5G5_SCHAZ|nr:ABC transporter permease [Schinkia azotoformans]EKN67757.1 ABC transporter permease [Schinkia azotoformans LMG 9581]MEC1637473.1 ABC transporter permease [Schinkia azotoformans]MEC1718993.1 ABC transporter permease [Schinkia azotoformans]MEC1943877.1 ABC transporter permease [Schinkia azotoformans]MED4411977.1 ABC transporter permease [Schinkia azotoformans]